MKFNGIWIKKKKLFYFNLIYSNRKLINSFILLPAITEYYDILSIHMHCTIVYMFYLCEYLWDLCIWVVRFYQFTLSSSQSSKWREKMNNKTRRHTVQYRIKVEMCIDLGAWLFECQSFWNLFFLGFRFMRFYFLRHVLQ